MEFILKLVSSFKMIIKSVSDENRHERNFLENINNTMQFSITSARQKNSHA